MAVQRRVAEYRQRMREAGLRPVQLWVPDVRRPDFTELARRESVAVNLADADDDIMLFLEEHSALEDHE